MTREEKDQFIDQIAEKLESNKNIYLTDISGLTVSDSNDLRRICFKKGVEMQVVKNTLLKKAMEKVEANYEESYELLVGNTALMFSEIGSAPAKVIKDFRKKADRPVLKAAFIEESFYLGDEQVKELSTLKSKEELIGEIITLLQSPAKNVISALQSGGGNLSGILTTLGNRTEEAPKAEEPVEEAGEATEEIAPVAKEAPEANAEEAAPEAEAKEEEAAEASDDSPEASAEGEEAKAETSAEEEGEAEESSEGGDDEKKD